MKKLICILISLVLIFGTFCGCSETDNGESSKTASEESPFLPARTYSTGKGTPWTFDNSYYKLTKEKKFTVAYIGGSVTVGTGSTEDECWRAYTTNYLRAAYPDAEITTIDSGYGGTSSLWGSARLQSMIIDKKPDLIFIEFSINDLYNGLGEDQSAALMDGMLRKINKQLPNCDVVILSVVDNQTVLGQSLNAKAHKDVAEYFGVKYLDLGIPMNEALEKLGKTWGESGLASDSVHPNKDGYKVYGDYIEKQLREEFKQSAARNISGLKAHEIPEKPYTTNPILKAETVWAKDIPCEGTTWGTGRKPSTGKYGTESIRAKKDSVLTYEFSGTMIGMFGTFNKGSKGEILLDGGNKRNIGTVDKQGEVVLYDNLDPNVKHTLTVTVTGKGLFEITAFFIG